MQLRCGPLRGDGAPDDGQLLPLQALSAPQRCRGFAAAHPAEGSFRIVSGTEKLRMWQPEGGGEKWFCGECGSSLFARNPSHANPVGIRMGAFDTDPGVRPSVRQFVASAVPWEPIPDDGLPRFPGSRHARS